MCMIDDAEPYIEVFVPADFVVKQCTDCGRSLTLADEPELYAGVMREDLPDLHAWMTDRDRWMTDEEWEGSTQADWLGQGVLRIEWRKPRDGEVGWRDCGTSVADVQSEFDIVPSGVTVKPHVHVTCAQCLEGRRWLMAVCNGWLYDGICEDIAEHWHESELMRTHALGRLTLAVRNHWHHRDGSLMTREHVAMLVDRSLAQLVPEMSGG